MPKSTIGYMFGVFDLINVEHLDLFRQASTWCDHLVVAVARDALVRDSGGRAPLTHEVERAAIVASLRGICRVELLHSRDILTGARAAGAQVLFRCVSGDAVQRAVNPSLVDTDRGVLVVDLVPRRWTRTGAVRDRMHVPVGNTTT